MAAVRLRPIALPTEHGGWALVGAPIVLGVWVAPSPAGAWLSVAALGAFLARQPLDLAVSDWRRGRRYPRTAWAERFLLLFAGCGLAAFGVAWLTAGHPFWVPLAMAAPLAAIQVGAGLVGRSRAPAVQACGAAAAASTVAAVAMAAGWTLPMALALWATLALQAVAAIVYVGIRLRLARGVTASRVPAHAVHLLALVVVCGLAWSGLVPRTGVVVFAVLALRAALGLRPRSLPTPTPQVGVQEIGASLLTVAGIALGVRLGW